MLQYDIVIVGAGGGGLYAALETSKSKGLKVAVISKVFPTRSHTGAAQGGINAALGNVAPDSPEKHAYDTVKGSDYLADQDAVELMCQTAPRIIREMEHMGLPFSRLPDGRIAQRPFGGASFPRTCYAADKTGHVMLQTLYEQCIRNGVTFLDEWFALSLVHNGERIAGLVAMDLKTGKVEGIQAKAVILATGGHARIYWKRTSNALGNTGDGPAMALRAGVPLKDMEFVQFHPTGLRRTGILVTEGARGEGGYLINNKGERFMKRYAPEKMELAPRDLVSRAIETEIMEGRGFEDEEGNKFVYLDLRHLGRKKILERLPQIRELAIDFEGVDPIEEPIPIRPTAHYSMGGIDTDIYGRTLIKGLYAIGECGCVSVHGANRLGGNSLLDIVVFGKIAGEDAAEFVPEVSQVPFPEGAVKREEERIKALFNGDGSEKLYKLRNELSDAMSAGAGIFREEKGLREALEKVRQIKERAKKLKVEDGESTFNTNLQQTLEFLNMVEVAETIVLGALERKESRGAHYRLDYPKRDDEKFLKHSVIVRGEDGELKLSWKPVTITKWQPEERKY
ncbi:succinate dehydrogenase flavoprotein subunit [Thermovibrio ammonificans]|jgi:succinate dehydrogenase / fumarate reductase flavoprotein subunit|uniref:Succinate dehydrogenase flavoprotein subunit n=1 Tax=Thermovibrio ammonificans (strain DSM 15698 / JCM 12110 / HB-1) TaxID=648996 RepID=E8T3A4_THEA1|nr:succinate dehydrogenase flavoprotein subunit [Thermovibrio ammonificans]ADU97236.1 succinate dehydrogenase or fumarate reductase, flavoprotein subunit [Thermovibrio ammonificans HB-1]